MKKLILSAVFASTLAATGAYAQTETTATTTSTTTTVAPDKKEQAREDKARAKEEKLREKADKIQNKEQDRNKDQAAVTETQTSRTTTTAQNAGTVEEYTPGESIVVRTEAAEPVHYRLSKEVVYVNGAGQVIEANTIRKSARVHYHFVQVGGETVVDRVIVD